MGRAGTMPIYGRDWGGGGWEAEYLAEQVEEREGSVSVDWLGIKPW